jgi:hypothetical protein
LNELGGIKVVKTKLTEQEEKELVNTLLERCAYFTPLDIEQIDELVDARYECVKSRVEFVCKAVSWFLAQTEGG